MTIDPLRRARLVGVLMIVAAFGLGVAAGLAIPGRTKGGTTFIVTATDQVPAELERLNLTPDQRGQIEGVLRSHRPRVLAILDEMEPRIQSAINATEREIAAVLDDAQRSKWEEYRRANPPLKRQKIVRP